MAFSREDAWVWDFWFADDGETYHLYYLFAPKQLGDPELRHRNARIGHAVSTDLTNWTDLGLAFDAGTAGSFDETATWTGCVVRGDDGLWRMFYTGSVFPSAESATNIESIGSAVSADLNEWTKQPAVVRADPRWYETLGDSDWPEEAWRDPWVFRDPDGHGWHMLITARSRDGELYTRGVVGHARSDDLVTWVVGPRSAHSAATSLTSRSCSSSKSTDDRRCSSPLPKGSATTTVRGACGCVESASELGPFSIDDAELLTERRLYSGRVIQNRQGAAVLLAFELGPEDHFLGGITDPLPLEREDGRLTLGVGQPTLG